MVGFVAGHNARSGVPQFNALGAGLCGLAEREDCGAQNN
jgi:hypothetical protein